MDEFKAEKKDARTRILLITVFLFIWTLGISALISKFSPDENLIKSAPVSDNDRKNIEQKIKTLEAQNKITNELGLRLLEIAKDYENASAFLKSEFKEIIKTNINDKDINFNDAFKNFLILIGSNDNPTIGNDYSKELLSISIDIDSDKTGADSLKNIFISFLNKDVRLIKKPEDDSLGEEISYFSVYSIEEISSGLIKIETTSTSVNLKKIFNLNQIDYFDRKALVEQAYGNNYDKSNILIKNISVNSLDNKTIIKNILDAILNEIEKNKKLLNDKSKRYIDISSTLLQSQKDLESRLLSSQPLFAVLSFRASLILIVFVSIGFILIRALASELAQARRISCFEISFHILNSLDTEKLNTASPIIDSISKERNLVKKNTNELPSAANLMEKTGDAVSKILTSNIR